MNWFFLSTFAERLRVKEERAIQSKPIDICWKETKFNELYMKDKSKTEKLYTKFTQTRAYNNFLSSSSLSNCFN